MLVGLEEMATDATEKNSQKKEKEISIDLHLSIITPLSKMINS